MSNPNKPVASKPKKPATGKQGKADQQLHNLPPDEKEKAFDTQSEFNHATRHADKHK
jgi:hypothetical protein